MSDAAPEVHARGVAQGDGPPLTRDRIDAVLGDFRAWLEGVAEVRAGEPPGSQESVDLFTLVGQFTALRHEVNLQTKAARAATEQTAEALKALAPRPDPDDAVRPLVKALIDIADALATSLRQVEKAQAALDGLSTQYSVLSTQRPGFFARLFGAREAQPAPNADAVRPVLAGVADGYALSLRRVERVLPQYGLEPIPCEGEAFDPELMEVLEVVDGGSSGSVVEEVRRGYWWNGKVFRFALVKVAR